MSRWRQASLLERCLTKIDVDSSPDGCWLWTGAASSHGYGHITRGRASEGQIPAHRALYELIVGPIPEGLELDHLCFNTRCVNPDHLEPVTHAVNAQRRSARTTHCPRGHPYDETNTYRRPDGTKRDCRACRREADQRRRRNQS